MMIEEEMIKNRIILLNDEVDRESAKDVILKLLYLNSLSNEDINLYINSPGGDVIQGLAIVDCMNYIKSNVNTFCIGSAYSMGAIILTCGSKRYALPNSEILIHEPSGTTNGNATNVLNSSNRIEHMRTKLAQIISKTSKKPMKKVLKDMIIDNFMSAEKAKEYGLIDEIISF